MIDQYGKIKCDWCGRFVSYSDIEKGEAFNRMVYPESDLTKETFESCCKKCFSRMNREIYSHHLSDIVHPVQGGKDKFWWEWEN